MRRPLLLLIATLLLLGGLPTAAEAAQPTPPAERYARIIVKFKPGSATTLGIAATHAKRTRPGSDVCTVKAEKDSAAQLAKLLIDPKVEWAEPDYPMQVAYTSTPNDPYLSDGVGMVFNSWTPPATIYHARSWYLRGYGSLNADTMWPYLESSTTKQYGARADAAALPIAVIDTGFYMDHPDRGPNISAGKDMFESYTYATDTLVTDYDVTPLDPNVGGNDIITASHGTCVAGEIAAAADNGVGTTGVAYDPLVRIYKVQGLWTDYIDPVSGLPTPHQYIFTTIVADAIRQATDDGCKIINMSLGDTKPSTYLQSAVDYAHANGVVVVAASGNDAAKPVLYPAACNYAIGVGSYNISGNSAANPTYYRSSFTSYGTGLDVLAPGAGIWGFIKPGFDADGAGAVYQPGYSFWNGTSMASPLFAGGIAALWRLAPSLTNDEIANFAITSAHDLGPAGYDTDYGWGVFDLDSARKAIVATYPELPAPTITSKPSDPTSATVGSVSWSAVDGYNVNYDVTLDGTTWNTGGTSSPLSPLSEGVHQVRVTAKSDRNWYDRTRSSAAFSFTVDRTAPAAPVFSVTDQVASWGTPPADVAAIEVRVGSGPPVTLAGSATSYDMRPLGLSVGAYQVDVRFGDAAVNFSAWSSQPFTVTAVPLPPSAVWLPVYRFYRASTGTHFYTADAEEMARVRDTMASTYSLDGPAYTINTANPANSVPLYRFYNRKTGTHLYTADEGEKAGIEANLSDTYSLDGVAYNVSMTSGLPVHRFFSPAKGVHFYSADPVEIEFVRTNLGATWQYEGVAYRIGQ